MCIILKVYLNIYLRYAEAADMQIAAVVLAAPNGVWEKLISEKKDPLFLIMSGVIRVEKGSMLKLGLQRNAAKALLNSAGQASGDIAPVPEPEPEPEPVIQTPSAQSQPGMAPGFTPVRSSYATTSRGLDFDSYPMQLFQKAKQLGSGIPLILTLSRTGSSGSLFQEKKKI